MKKIVFVGLILVVVLTACATAATPAPAPAPTDAPAVAAPAATAAPTDVPAQPAAQNTNTPAAPAAPADTAQPAAAATNTKPPSVGKSVFSNPTRSGDAFSLRCSPSQITFSVTSINPAITGVDLYYRVEDKAASQPSGTWLNGAKMDGDGKGNFSIEFTALKVAPDARVAKGWFDYQFVGVNKYGDVVGRSDKFTQQVTFTLDCP